MLLVHHSLHPTKGSIQLMRYGQDPDKRLMAGNRILSWARIAKPY